MHAEFLIRHSAMESTALKNSLVSKFHAENRAALKESPLFDSGKWDSSVLYATQTPSYRLFGVPTQDEELQIYVEPIKGNVIDVCESIWLGARGALKAASPGLTGIKLIDNDKEFLTAKATCLTAELRRRENLTPILIGAAAVLYTGIGLLTFASTDAQRFVAGAVTGLVGALVALALAIAASRGRRLIWD